ncbi:DUF2138 domain-containing protein [Betaproteobacteria bacterium]|nr:DUF2138 domain-containing protein [Betaproteobacteria bacterium]
MSAIRKLALILFVAVLLATSYAVYRVVSPAPFQGLVSDVKMELARPDALIRTDSLSRLPPDLLKLPVARDVLTEDFVDYYEHHESRLSLAGTLRRIAYEHKLELPGQLLESVFNEPAEVALWRDSDGKLKYFAVAMTRNALARAIQLVLPALPDVQARSGGKLLESGADILVLDYGYQHRLVLVAKGERVVALSDPGMLFETAAATDADKESAPPAQSATAAKLVARLLEAEDKKSPGVSPFAEHFQLKALADNGHELVLGARAFAFGYEAFTPGLAALALRFDHEGKWTSSALLDASLSWQATDLWAALPHGASLCAALPVDWIKFAPLLSPVGFNAAAATAFVDRFKGPAAVCWYKDARLYTPIFAAQLKSEVDETQVLDFFQMVENATQGDGGVMSFDAQTRLGKWQSKVEQSRVESRYGVNPALGVARNVVLFSPDAALVQKALDVGAKRYPALGDSLGNEADVLALIAPEALAGLLKKETFAALPRKEEAIFRNAADAYLAPRLDALARYPAQRMRISPGSDAWHELVWEDLRK